MSRPAIFGAHERREQGKHSASTITEKTICFGLPSQAAKELGPNRSPREEEQQEERRLDGTGHRDAWLAMSTAASSVAVTVRG